VRDISIIVTRTKTQTSWLSSLERLIIPLRKYNTRAKAELRFGSFKMKSDMTLGVFFEQFVEHRRILTAQKDEVPHPKREAQNFLLRIDERYAEMLVSMDSGSITGKPYPGSLEEAYEVTRLWAIPTHKKVATSATTLIVSEEGSRARDGGGRGSRGGSGRGTGGRGGRGPSKRGSPPPKLLKKTVKFVKEEPKGTEKADMMRTSLEDMQRLSEERAHLDKLPR
jgi:hypothetical protein